MVRLNVGCGRTILPGWLNLDIQHLPGVDVVADLEACRTTPLPLEDESVDEFLLSHVIEHIRDSLAMMQELYRVATPEARMVIRVPHGASDDAFEDPTHVRQFFQQSFGYFSQPYYWRADYGYRGDWEVEQIQLFVRQADWPDTTRVSPTDMLHRINRERNLVTEMVVTLYPVKPMREPLRDLQQVPTIIIQHAE
ncbi:methyltransferase domain-containing protein [Deinococcus sp. HMF7620]|uniref:Methyltransferase domain-containing protein n=1 Tax=Deinococcus arboris TaxID=2682977 RepID=A0A7C9LKJ3_9DEIO|nr:methyltransferase domain-containing protein [Deinococcus arboris]MVN86718.1 methyltransferase domain-containing protein [Deinococcus arboris]